MKTDWEIVIGLSRNLEAVLERNLSAQGKGLHEKIGSVSAQLPSDLIRDLRYIATMRSKMGGNDSGHSIADRRHFEAVAHKSMQRLQSMRSTGPASAPVVPSGRVISRGRSRHPWVIGFFVGVIIFLTAAIYDRSLTECVIYAGIGMMAGGYLSAIIGKVFSLAIYGVGAAIFLLMMWDGFGTLYRKFTGVDPGIIDLRGRIISYFEKWPHKEAPPEK